MSNSEDYLDDLLHAATSEKSAGMDSTTQEAEGIMDSEKNFLDDFEKMLFEEDDDDSFLRDFEKELGDVEEETSENTGRKIENEPQSAESDFLEDLGGIIEGAKQVMEETSEAEMESGQEDFVPEIQPEGMENPSKPEAEAETFQELENLEEGMSDEDDLMSLFEGDGDFADLMNSQQEGEAPKESDAEQQPQEKPALEPAKEAETAEASSEDKKGKKKSGEKESFWKKLGRILFGEDDEEEMTAEADVKEAAAGQNGDEIQNLSEEDLEILQALGGAVPQGQKEEKETEEQKKARLKKEKKEAKEQKKKEQKEAKEKKAKEKKELKEKKAKEKKEKKAKEPKVKDNTPPLPKKPVILMFVMSASFLVLVLLGSKLVNYSSSIADTKQAMIDGDYQRAYEQIAGIKVKKADMPLYERARILASLQSQYDAYQVFYANEYYDLALDSLISVIGRFDLNYENALLYECTIELENIEQIAEKALLDQFGVTVEQARELYAIKKRSDYSMEVYKIIYSLGLEKVAEE